jgi:RND family efflux transporter MFP subunit
MARWHKPLSFALIVAGGLASGCGHGGDKPAKPAAPAKVAQPVKETQLNTVVLTPEAEQRLGVQTAEVQRRPLRRLQSYAGEISLPTNAVLTVSAPVSGTLQMPNGHTLPAVGARVQKGQPMFGLVPHVLTQAEKVSLAQAQLQLGTLKIEADGKVKQAQVQVDAAKTEFDRTKRLYEGSAGTRKEFDDAVAKLQLAQKGLDAALLSKSLVDGMHLDTEAVSVKPLVIPAPRKGIVRATFAVGGETVPSGTPLFEIMNADTVWVKVPVYVGEVAEVADRESAQINNLADAPGASGVLAKPVQTPPTAQAQASAIDLYYELPNPDGKYRPGERVSVLLPLKGEDKSLSLPWSAVVHDIYGGTWVYVQTAPRTYARQRVQVRFVVGDRAVLAEGPAVGARVVTAGTAELFGTEFGFGK